MTFILVIPLAKPIFIYRELDVNYGKQCLLYQGLEDWNKLNKSIRDIKSILLFKQALKNVHVGISGPKIFHSESVVT